MRGVRISQNFTDTKSHNCISSNINCQIFKFKKQAFKILCLKIQEKKLWLTKLLTTRPYILCLLTYMLTIVYYYYYLFKLLLLYYIILYSTWICLWICYSKKQQPTGSCRRNEDEKPMLTYMLTMSFLAIWFSFSDLRCLKNVPWADAIFQNVNVNVNV